jgi:hypothetical protein
MNDQGIRHQKRQAALENSIVEQLKAARRDAARLATERNRLGRARDEIRAAREQDVLATLPASTLTGRPVPVWVFARKWGTDRRVARAVLHGLVVCGQVEYIRSGDTQGYVLS